MLASPPGPLREIFAGPSGFADWRLPVGGLVATPRSFSLADLRAMTARKQTTLHSCEQGWSAIGCWTGIPLAPILLTVGMMPQAKFVVIRTVDGWWDTYDMFDALHPQTILAYGMNGGDLPIAHGRRSDCASSGSSATRARNT